LNSLLARRPVVLSPPPAVSSYVSFANSFLAQFSCRRLRAELGRPSYEAKTESLPADGTVCSMTTPSCAIPLWCQEPCRLVRFRRPPIRRFRARSPECLARESVPQTRLVGPLSTGWRRWAESLACTATQRDRSGRVKRTPRRTP
jgi:hypothetical protein